MNNISTTGGLNKSNNKAACTCVSPKMKQLYFSV